MSAEFYRRSAQAGDISEQGGQVTVDFASCGAAAVTLQTVTIQGADVGDIVLMTPPAAGLSVAVACLPGYVSAANTVKMPVVNPTAGALDPASAVFDYVLIKKPGQGFA